MSNRFKNILKQLRLNESTISMILGALVVIVVGILVVNYFRNVGQPSSSQEVKEEAVNQEENIGLDNLPTTYTVKSGDDLWKIAEKIYGSGYNWVSISKENKLTNPNKITVGQQLAIPKAEVITPVKTASPVGESITGSTYTVQKNDHLWKIALRAYGDGYQWAKIARENKLVNPSLIHPGNILNLPR